MKKGIKLLLLTTAMAWGLGAAGLALSDDDEREEGERHSRWLDWYRPMSLDVAPTKNQAYRDECGSCHFAYQPGLLPVRSWEKLMGSLDNHFGENAELLPDDRDKMLEYLRANAADVSDYKRSKRVTASLGEDETPLRITDTPYFKRKHDEIPHNVISRIPEIGSYSNCASCHRRADNGSYNEHEVNIPGIGRWED